MLYTPLTKHQLYPILYIILHLILYFTPKNFVPLFLYFYITPPSRGSMILERGLNSNISDTSGSHSNSTMFTFKHDRTCLLQITKHYTLILISSILILIPQLATGTYWDRKPSHISYFCKSLKGNLCHFSRSRIAEVS